MTDDVEMKDIGEVLGGLKISSMPEGWTPLEALVLVKCIDDQGDATWVYRMTDGTNDEELLGALTIQTALMKRHILSTWDLDDGDED